MSRRILLADDSVTIQKVIELTFMDEDFEVTAVSNGDEAVALLPQLQPDFVIADVHMPGANGYEVCRRAKALAGEVPVLLLVGTFEPFDEGQAKAAGSDAYLKKPFDSQELLHIVQSLLDKGGQGVALPSIPAMSPTSPTSPTSPISPTSAPPPLTEALPELPAEPEEALPELATADDWSSFELEPEPPHPAPPAVSAAPPPPPRPTWTAPEEESIFELEPSSEELSLDESLLPGELGETEGPAAEPSFGLGIVGKAEIAETPAPALSARAYPEATPEERVGVPIGAAPLAGGLSEVERRIEEHKEVGRSNFPDWTAPAAAPPTPPPPPTPAAAPAPAPATASAPAASSSLSPLSDADVDRIARRLVELMGEKVVKDIAWEVIPDLAEVVIKDRLRELESQVE
jgi:CheY-like chemotaxis protein